MCVYCLSAPYLLPVVYNPNNNFENCSRELVGDMFKSCMTIKNNETYYVGSDGRLHGYRWVNFPMRLLTKAKNKIQNGDIENRVIQKITQLFNFILNINTSFPILVNSVEDVDLSMGNTDFALSDKYFCTYTSLAEKILQKYSREQHSELYTLAHRVIHERPVYVEIPKVVTDADGDSDLEMSAVRNVAKIVKGSSYEFTTVWDT